ncbi:MAG: hypothetical protein ACRC3H_19240 [Lachnospiraceae bacterium]
MEIIIRDPNGTDDNRTLLIKKNFDVMSKMPIPTNEHSDNLVDWIRAYFVAEKAGLLIQMKEL